MVATPYLSSAPTSNQIRAVGDQPLHPLYTADRELSIIPLKFTTTAGALSTQEVTGLCYVTDQGSGVMRIYHPYTIEKGVYVFLVSDDEDIQTVTRTTADDGYIQIDIGGATATFQGYIALACIAQSHSPVVENAAISDGNLDRGAAERLRDRARSHIHDLIIGALRFTVDVSGVPVTSSGVAGTYAFHVDKTGTGTYTVKTTTEFSTAFRFMASTDGGGMVLAEKGSGDGEIDLTVKVAGTPTDPASEELRLLFMGPGNSEGKRLTEVQLSAVPPTLPARSRNHPAWCLWRGAALLTINFTGDGSGNLSAADANTVVPPNVKITHDSGTYYVEFGRAQQDLVVADFHDSVTGEGLDIDYSEVEDKGRISFPATLTSDEIHGWILVKTNSQA